MVVGRDKWVDSEIKKIKLTEFGEEVNWMWGEREEGEVKSDILAIC